MTYNWLLHLALRHHSVYPSMLALCIYSLLGAGNTEYVTEPQLPGFADTLSQKLCDSEVPVPDSALASSARVTPSPACSVPHPSDMYPLLLLSCTVSDRIYRGPTGSWSWGNVLFFFSARILDATHICFMLDQALC